jgi:hypothetical protein
MPAEVKGRIWRVVGYFRSPAFLFAYEILENIKAALSFPVI